ncbi:MAG: stage V sporulation protein AC [Ruminococcaceae bacterium]|nr:stage V sporulation protein AC [Oscillospiraceae bacterium]
MHILFLQNIIFTKGVIILGKKTAYQKYADRTAKKSPLFIDCTKAFIVGGLICTFAEALFNLYLSFSISEETVKILVPSTLIFITAIFTGIGIFDRLAKHAGAGTLVPITGFANAVVSPALDTKAEGFILGVGAKMFTIAGPVIVYGTVASVVYGVIYWITTLF